MALPLDPYAIGAPEIQPEPWAWVPPEWDAPEQLLEPQGQAVDDLLREKAASDAANVATQPPIPVASVPVDPYGADPSPVPVEAFGGVSTPSAEPLLYPEAPNWSGLVGQEPAGVPRDPYPQAAPELYPEGAPTKKPIDLNPNLSEEELGNEIVRFAKEDPEGFARHQIRQQVAAEERALTQQIAADREYRAKVAAEEERHRAVIERVRARQEENEAESDRLANEKIDPDGWMNSRSTFQKIAAVLAGVVGGLVQSRKGGPNLGLEMVQSQIRNYMDTQKANLAHRRDMLARKGASLREQMEQEREDHKQLQAFELSAYKRVQGELQAKAMEVDPRGTMANRYASAIMALKERENAARAQQAKELYKLEGEELDRDKTRAEIERIRAQASAERAKLVRGGGGSGSGSARPKPGEVVYPAEQVAEWFKDFAPPVGGWQPMTAQQVGTLAEKFEKIKTVNKETEADKLARTLRIPDMNGDPLVSKDENGKSTKDWFIGKDDEAAATRAALEKTANTIRMSDELRYIRREHGGSSSWLGSDEEKRSKVLQANIFAAIKSGMEGMSSDADGERMLAMAGAANPTSFRDQDAALKEGREQMLAGINAKLARHGYKGDPVKIKDSYENKPKKTADELALDAMIKDTTSPMELDPKAPISDELRAGIERGLAGGIKLSDAHKKKIDEWAAAATGFDPKPRDAKYTLLTELVRRTRSPAVLEYAEGVLKDVEAFRAQLDSAGGE